MPFLTAVVAGVVVMIGAIVALRFAGDGVRTIQGMFKPPTDLGWPPGVQEDDDERWTWEEPPEPPDGTIEELPVDR